LASISLSRGNHIIKIDSLHSDEAAASYNYCSQKNNKLIICDKRRKEKNRSNRGRKIEGEELAGEDEDPY
jgi:hypothetical protein